MKTFIMIILVIYVVMTPCFAQYERTSKTSKENQILIDSITNLRKEINNLDYKLRIADSVNNRMYFSIIKSINSNKKIVDDSRLRESLKSAESTISYQNTFVYIFGIIFGLVGVGAGILYFFSFRPMIKQADKAFERTNSAANRLEDKITNFTNEVDSKIKNHFELFEKKESERNINEVFDDLESKLPNKRKLQIEKLSTIDIQEFKADRIIKIFQALDSITISEDEKSIIIEKLIQIDNYQVQSFFENWSNITNDEYSIMNQLYQFYITKGLSKYLVPIKNFILNKVDPHLEFIRLLDILPSHPDYIIELLNYKDLVNSLNDHSKKSTIDHIKNNLNSWNLVEKNKVEESFLFQFA